MLFAALLALLAVVDVYAMDAELTDPVFLHQEGIVAPCALEPQDGDPLMSFDTSDVDCVSFEMPEVRSVEFTGNVAWATVVVGDDTELHVYRRTDTGWERFPYSSEPDAEYVWMIEQETAALEENVNPASIAATVSGDATSFNASMTAAATAFDADLVHWEEVVASLVTSVEGAFVPSAATSVVDVSPVHWEDLVASLVASVEDTFVPNLQTNPLGSTASAPTTESSFDAGLVHWEDVVNSLVASEQDTFRLDLSAAASVVDPGIVHWEDVVASLVASEQDAFGPDRAAGLSSRSDSTWAVQSEGYWDYLADLEGGDVEPATGSTTVTEWWNILWAPQGEAYWDYLADLEGTDVGR
jgi:hypothetical protein